MVLFDFWWNIKNILFLLSCAMDPLIRVIDLWKRYGESSDQGFAALRGCHLEVASGELVALYGASGSGKTTLLNLLAGLDQPTEGMVEIEGQSLEELGETGRTQVRRKQIGFVFQFFNLLPTLTALENVSLAMELAGMADGEYAAAALHDVGLAGKENRFPHQLSGGEQQRVALARALVKKPAIILADEPTGNLDTHTGMQVLELLTTQCREPGTTNACSIEELIR